MSEPNPAIAPDQLTLRQLFLSLKLRHFVTVIVFFFGALAAAFGIAKTYSDAKKELEIAAMNTTKVSLEAELKARDREIQQLTSEKTTLTQTRQTLIEESAAFRRTIGELTQTIARMGLCEPIRTQLSEVIRVHGQTKERLLLLETAHKDYRVEKRQVDTTRQQVTDLEQDIQRLRGRLSDCHSGLTRRSTGPAESKLPAGR